MDAEGRRRLQEALVRLADGDRSAFAPVYTLAWPLTRRFALSLLRGAPDAEDAAQEALLRVFSRAGEFDRSRDALAWILGIAAFACRTHRRRQGRRREEPMGPEERSSPLALEEELVTADLIRAAREVMAGLPALDAETLAAAFEEPARTRAAVAGATFRKRLERARRRLRQAWSEKHGLG